MGIPASTLTQARTAGPDRGRWLSRSAHSAGPRAGGRDCRLHLGLLGTPAGTRGRPAASGFSWSSRQVPGRHRLAITEACWS